MVRRSPCGAVDSPTAATASLEATEAVRPGPTTGSGSGVSAEAREWQKAEQEAEVGVVYSVAPFVRTADDILGELQSVAPDDARPRPKRPRPVNKRLFASIAKSYSDVIDQGFQEALARDPLRRRRWVVLLDGNPDQIGAVHRAAARTGVEITLIADLIHLIEYLWPAAYAFHAPGSDEARDWVVARVRALLNGADPSQVAAGIRRSATLQALEKRAAVDDCAGYMLKLAPATAQHCATDCRSRRASSRARADTSSGGVSTSGAHDGRPRAPRPSCSSAPSSCPATTTPIGSSIVPPCSTAFTPAGTVARYPTPTRLGPRSDASN